MSENWFETGNVMSSSLGSYHTATKSLLTDMIFEFMICLNLQNSMEQTLKSKVKQ